MAITKLNNKAVANVTSIPVALGDMVLVSSATASSSATIDFTLGDYKEYQFYFVNINPSVDGDAFLFNFSTDNGSNYNVVKTSMSFRAYHDEADTATTLSVSGAENRLAQSTAFQTLTTNGIGTDADQNYVGTLEVFNPSSVVFVKHFLVNAVSTNPSDYAIHQFMSGYANTTSALTNIRFKMSSGNIDAGKILMFGIN